MNLRFHPFRWILFLGFCSLTGYFLFPSSNTLPESSSLSLSSPSSSVTPSVSVPTRPLTGPLLSSSKRSPLNLPPTPRARDELRSVDFEVVGHLAIAYGDIILGQIDPESKIQKGYTEPPPTHLWDAGAIPYAIHSNLPNPERVEEAVEYFRKNARISFVPYQGQADAIIFESGEEHCYSALGRIGGLQPIRLSPQCRPQEIIHEIMHALGFFHEQSRPDRNDYIEIHWNNIEERYHPQFAIVPPAYTEALGDSNFDYHSIMIYRPYDFAIQTSTPVLTSKTSEPIEPIAYGLSAGDLKRLNHLYGR